MDRGKLYERLMATFVDELSEHVESINSCVLELETVAEKSKREDVLARLFRAAHSLKGAARAVDVPPIERICHCLEDVFTAIRDDKIVLESETASLIFSAADSVDSAGRLLRERLPVPDDHFQQLPEQLQAVAGAAKPNKATDKSTKKVRASPPAKEPEPTINEVPVTAQAATAPPKEAQPLTPPPTETLAPEPQEASVPRRSLGTSVRVAEEKLDSLMAQAGELHVARQRIEIRPGEVEVIAGMASSCRADFQSVERSLLNLVQRHGNDSQLTRSRRHSARLEQIVEQTGETLRQLESQLEELQRRLLGDTRQLNHVGETLQQDIHRTRMLPFSDGCAGLDRAVRDVARTTGKSVNFVIEGGDIEVDRTVLEGLRDPLLHLVRNAVDHGLEVPSERAEAGKAAAGEVRVAARLRGSQIDITISDDGRGLNRDAILKQLRAKHLPEPRDDRELFRSIFLHGFSTAKLLTDVSGRGVGMDVVKSQLESLHGTIDLSTQPGLGMMFSLSVPLTLTTISALFVRAGEQILAIPSTNISRLVRFRPEEIRSMSGQQVLSLGGSPVPVKTLSAALQMTRTSALMEHDHLTGVLLTTGDREMVVVVDELIGERDTVVKNLGVQIRRSRFVSGATLLRTGDVALLLNAAAVVRTRSSGQSAQPIVDTETAVETAVARKVLVVDDSVTTRSLLKNILEAAGYDVTAAVDGEDAWARLQTTDIELVVSDVDMPRMDGFVLTARIRQSEKFKRMPVILVTSRDSEEDKTKGVEAGADAYLIKGAFHQSNVLDAIEQLL